MATSTTEPEAQSLHPDHPNKSEWLQTRPGEEDIARSEDEDVICDGDLQLSGEDMVDLILTRMRMTRHPHPGRETQFQQTVVSSGICAR